MTAWVADLSLITPLFGLALTLSVYATALSVYANAGMPGPLHPVLVSTVAVGGILMLTGIPYSRYFEQTWLLHEGLGLFVVLLAVPLYRHMALIRSSSAMIGLALVIGSVAAVVTAIALPGFFGAELDIVATLLPKSSTTAIAVSVSERLDGIASLTAIVVITTGLFGAAFGPGLLAAAGIQDHRAVGLALGVASHAIGTARAFQISETAGTFASVGMILNGLLTILLAPAALALFTS